MSHHVDHVDDVAHVDHVDHCVDDVELVVHNVSNHNLFYRTQVRSSLLMSMTN